MYANKQAWLCFTAEMRPRIETTSRKLPFDAVIPPTIVALVPTPYNFS